jgi:hypothetical protein
MTPRLFLDVDGVINAVCRGNNPRDCWPDYQTTVVEGFRITWSSQVAKRLARLDDHVEINWLTTWEHLAPQLLAPFMRLPNWPVAERSSMSMDSFPWWKLDVVRSYWEKDQRPFIWLDDDIGYFYDPHVQEFVQELPAGSCMLVCPETRRGLEPHHFNEIDYWLEELARKR